MHGNSAGLTCISLSKQVMIPDGLALVAQPLDLSFGCITGVDYNSEAPLARRLATLRLALGERPTVAEFLGALRGARVEIKSGAGTTIGGKLLSVERKTRMGTAGSVEMEQISLIS